MFEKERPLGHYTSYSTHQQKADVFLPNCALVLHDIRKIQLLLKDTTCIKTFNALLIFILFGLNIIAILI